MKPRREAIVAIDPGDSHVGIATWISGHDQVECYEVDAADAVSEIGKLILRLGVTTLVIEAFTLYGPQAQAQTGSSMLTSQLIGALKHMAFQHGTPVVEQGASIKRPTFAQAKARGIRIKSKSQHARDAGAHAVYFVLRNELGLRTQQKP